MIFGHKTLINVQYGGFVYKNPNDNNARWPYIQSNTHTLITLTPYMVLPLFATRFADYAGGIRVSFIQPRLF